MWTVPLLTARVELCNCILIFTAPQGTCCIAPFYWQGSWNSKRMSNMSGITQLVTVSSQAVGFKPVFLDSEAKELLSPLTCPGRRLPSPGSSWRVQGLRGLCLLPLELSQNKLESPAPPAARQWVQKSRAVPVPAARGGTQGQRCRQHTRVSTCMHTHARTHTRTMSQCCHNKSTGDTWLQLCPRCETVLCCAGTSHKEHWVNETRCWLETWVWDA